MADFGGLHLRLVGEREIRARKEAEERRDRDQRCGGKDAFLPGWHVGLLRRLVVAGRGYSPDAAGRRARHADSRPCSARRASHCKPDSVLSCPTGRRRPCWQHAPTISRSQRCCCWSEPAHGAPADARWTAWSGGPGAGIHVRGIADAPTPAHVPQLVSMRGERPGTLFLKLQWWQLGRWPTDLTPVPVSYDATREHYSEVRVYENERLLVALKVQKRPSG